MAAGPLRDRVTFQAESHVSDGGGGNALTWTTVTGTPVWGGFRPERGGERLDGGRLAQAMGGTLKVRSSAVTRAITTEHRAVIDGTAYQIRSVSNPDRRNRWIEMVLTLGGDRGVTT